MSLAPDILRPMDAAGGDACAMFEPLDAKWGRKKRWRRRIRWREDIDVPLTCATPPWGEGYRGEDYRSTGGSLKTKLLESHHWQSEETAATHVESPFPKTMGQPVSGPSMGYRCMSRGVADERRLAPLDHCRH